MNYVGWKDIKSALRYVDPTSSFGGLALNATSIAPLQQPSLPER
jgi:hypothetical protein